jgi:hypothetical protein
MTEVKEMLDAVTPAQKWARVGMKAGLIGGMVGMLVAIGTVIVVSVVIGAPWYAAVAIGIVAFLFMAALLVIPYIVLKKVAGPQVDRKKLLEKGEPAEATILKVEDTGVTLNEIYPQIKVLLEIRPAGRPPYQAEIKMLINRLDIPQFQPGMVVPVMIDPRSPNGVAIVSGGGAAAVSDAAATAAQAPLGQEGAMKAMLLEVDKANQALMASGESAKAKILQSWWLGVYVNGNNPATKFQLEVHPDGKPPFQAEAIGVVAEASLPKYQPGNEIFVKFDPNNLTRVTIDHS